MMTDPIADLLTRIRNGLRTRKASVHVGHSRMKEGILVVLKREGFIQDFEVADRRGRKDLLVHLRYHRGHEPVIEGMERVSKPGRRVYASMADMPKIRGGLGISIVTTSKGIMTDAEAREARVGGEILCHVW